MADRSPARQQPDSFQWTEDNKAWCEKEITKFPEGRQASAVIPFLWRAQKQEGWVSIPAMEAIATQLGMPYIRVYEVATFYTMFNLKPVGTYFVQVCGTTPCMLRGSESLIEVCERVIGPQGAITESGHLSWLEVECLGACCNAPMAQINDYYYQDLTPEKFEEILLTLDKGEAVAPGVFNPARHTSDPEGDNTTLTDESLYDGSAAKPIDRLPNSAPAEQG
ncbi:NADH dehydrogenase I, E subunit [Parvularcula bermudensis HTCC2503]|uniref:NADH dehydrogenase I, E subunit n=1 Tax=Parvularcula bermudensis (strain ATCC BAA-594 / HTCC2503 / KCTC 12087) TaxID=314260 RepID=E0TBW2_PARBH|nr:NADH-quinone oxidoreductase subunit NuoE [Parvularcula bermudensis]ADM08455.1 NADH dehydrogenase I, E subunit [Parvularcula bermudensis HTCC2503]